MLGQVGSDSLPRSFPLGETPINQFGLHSHATIPSLGRCVLPYPPRETSPKSSRNLFTSGYPSTSLIERLGCFVGQRWPRPKVSPKMIQLAAR